MMLTPKFKYASIFLGLSIIFCIVQVQATAAESTLRFERMWPTFVQPWHFSGCYGFVVDSQDNLYFVNYDASSIMKFNPDGTFITSWGKKGYEDGEFAYPWSIAVDSNDNIYVADYGFRPIQKFTSSGKFITAWGGTGRENISLNALAITTD